MQSSIIQVSISPGGLPKRPIVEGWISPLGLEGDGHAHPQFHGGPKKAILIVAAEVVDELKALGYPVFYGALGENLTTRGLDVRNLRIGDQLRAGGSLLEITQTRVPCSALDIYGESLRREIWDKQMKTGDYHSPRWGMSGFMASVVEPGPVRPGDIISVVASLA
ncbi:MAG TPA: MOSC domain-containing protein [Bryobacteraceae bacterium]|nr:MOSC domain-containing protein [Bryobacteraceae bacterium]